MQQAHYVVITDKGLDHAREQVKMILADIQRHCASKSRRQKSNLPMREIVFDTETTGFEPGDGHRIVEIGCVELMDHFPTGRTLQFYLNPERDMPIESQRVHGLSARISRPTSRCSPMWRTSSWNFSAMRRW